MTNATATEPTIESLEAAVTEAQAGVTAAQATADKEMPALIKASNYGPEFTALADAIKTAGVKLERAQDALRAGRASSVWEQLVSIREPVVGAARMLIIDNPITLQITAVRGTITINDAGDAEVTLVPVVDRSKLDMSAIESMIAESVNSVAFKAEGVTSLDLDVTELGTDKAMVRLVPSSSKTGATRNSTGTRAGTLEYEFDGVWLGSHGLLEALEAAGHQVTTDRKQSFDTALRGTGNGLSNLAKSVSKALNIPTREVAPVTP